MLSIPQRHRPMAASPISTRNGSNREPPLLPKRGFRLTVKVTMQATASTPTAQAPGPAPPAALVPNPRMPTVAQSAHDVRWGGVLPRSTSSR